MMDLRQLQAFLAVVEHGGFTAAARATKTVQSNISTHVARLERELDATLIDRATGNPTQIGEAVVSRIRRIMGELDALSADVASLQGTPRGIVRIGIIGTTGRWITPLLVERLATQFPHIRLVVAEGTTVSLSIRLLEGDLDLALIGLPLDDPEIICTELFREDRIVIAPANHPVAQNHKVRIEELARHRLLLAAPGTPFRLEVNEAFARHNLTPKPQLEVDGLRLLASLAFQGYGVAIVPATAAPGWLEGTWTRIVIEELGQRSVGLAIRRRGLPSMAAQATADTVQTLIAEHAGSLTGVSLPAERQPETDLALGHRSAAGNG